MNYNIIDGFLDKSELVRLKKGLVHNGLFPLYMQRGISYAEHHPDFGNDGVFFIHTFFNLEHSDRPCSDYFQEYISPIIQKLNPSKLYRVRLNLYHKDYKRTKHGWHVDSNFPHKACIISLNTNNGGTILKKRPFNKYIKSKEGRAVIIDAHKEHRSVACSDQDYRVNLIVNYS